MPPGQNAQSIFRVLSLTRLISSLMESIVLCEGLPRRSTGSTTVRSSLLRPALAENDRAHATFLDSWRQPSCEFVNTRIDGVEPPLFSYRYAIVFAAGTKARSTLFSTAAHPVLRSARSPGSPARRPRLGRRWIERPLSNAFNWDGDLTARLGRHVDFDGSQRLTPTNNLDARFGLRPSPSIRRGPICHRRQQPQSRSWRHQRSTPPASRRSTSP